MRHTIAAKQNQAVALIPDAIAIVSWLALSKLSQQVMPK
jgi:hypothetical protein